MPGIRAVLLAGFLSGNAIGLLYLTLEGDLLESLQLNPLALFGAFLAVGLAGMMVGALCGLPRFCLEKLGAADGWQGPVVVSGTVYACVGFMISSAVIGALW